MILSSFAAVQDLSMNAIVSGLKESEEVAVVVAMFEDGKGRIFLGR
jgi:hypothetical protein